MDHTERYITTRISQLTEDRDKSSSMSVKQWYNRIAQELQWALEYHKQEFSTGCFMEKGDAVQKRQTKKVSLGQQA